MTWLGSLIWAFVVHISATDTYDMAGQSDLGVRCPHIRYRHLFHWLGRLILAFIVLRTLMTWLGSGSSFTFPLKTLMTCLGSLIWAFVVHISATDTYDMAGQADFGLHCPHIRYRHLWHGWVGLFWHSLSTYPLQTLMAWQGGLILAFFVHISATDTYGMAGQADFGLHCPHIRYRNLWHNWVGRIWPSLSTYPLQTLMTWLDRLILAFFVYISATDTYGMAG